jgi:hypothetical protein
VVLPENPCMLCMLCPKFEGALTISYKVVPPR